MSRAVRPTASVRTPRDGLAAAPALPTRSAPARSAPSLPHALPPRAALLAALALGAGCVHRLPLVVDPVGAYVSVGGERVGVAPMDVPVRTFGSRRVRVELTGYRTVEVRLPFFLPHGLEVRLVPEHGGAGSWDPSEAE